MTRAKLSKYWILCAGTLIGLCHGADAQPRSCPRADSSGIVKFADGTLLMRTKLEVNPDGASASYTPGDHGYTYIRNGVNIMIDGQPSSCSSGPYGSRCHQDWLEAEAGKFGPGTPEFCVFAMDVEPFRPNDPLVRCSKKDKSRVIAGNGKGRPKIGVSVPRIDGQSVPTYVSTTTLQHTPSSGPSYVDSSAIPGLVVPTSRGDLVGAIAWVKYGQHQGFAIVNNTGPRFGEGSVALHQLLRTGQVGPRQPIGPIPTESRCSNTELQLQRPFITKPDIDGDTCRRGRRPKGPADIRAYSGLGTGVVSIILARVKPPMSGHRVTEELSLDRLENWAASAGYTRERLASMADCLPR